MKMVDKTEMSLDDIIKQNKGGSRFRGTKRGGRRGRGPARTGRGGVMRGRSRGGISRSSSRGNMNSSWKKSAIRGALGSGGTTKLLVSNLDFGVSDSDIQELFSEFGPLKSAAVHYNGAGRSLGSADVIFERRADAIKAMKQYNGVPLDGREMNIQLATSEIPVPNTVRSASGSGRRESGGFGRSNRFKGSKGGAPRGRGGKGAGGRAPKKALTAEELDAELEAYVKEAK